MDIKYQRIIERNRREHEEIMRVHEEVLNGLLDHRRKDYIPNAEQEKELQKLRKFAWLSGGFARRHHDGMTFIEDLIYNSINKAA